MGFCDGWRFLELVVMMMIAIMVDVIVADSWSREYDAKRSCRVMDPVWTQLVWDRSRSTGFGGCPVSEQAWQDRILVRLVEYAEMDTPNDAQRYMQFNPTTPEQMDLAKRIEFDLLQLGRSKDELRVDLGRDGLLKVSVSDSETLARQGKRLGFYAHLDVTADFTNRGVRPMVWYDYRGNKIELPLNDQVLDPNWLPDLRDRVGDVLVTGSGDTLLGADDKGGIVAMVALAERLTCPNLKRPRHFAPIQLLFVPDGELTMIQRRFKDMEVDFVYCFDDGVPGDVRYESMNTALLGVQIKGFAMHTAFASGTHGHGLWYNRTLRNAISAGSELVAFLKGTGKVPEETEGREGFFHVFRFEHQGIDSAHILLWIRAFTYEDLSNLRNVFEDGVNRVKGRYPGVEIQVQQKDISQNIANFLQGERDARIEIAREATRQAGFTPVSTPVRGNTDASFFGGAGISAIHLFSAWHASHGPLEWTALSEMISVSHVAENIVSLWTEWNFTASSPNGNLR